MSDQEIYDICVVGSGPAGLSAAVNARVRRKKVAIFTGEAGLSKVNLSPRIDNYLGFPGINGNDLYEKFKRHVEEFKIPVIKQKVQTVGAMDDYFMLQTKEAIYNSRVVIIATGVAVQKLIAGEEKFVGRGVGYCATCDGPLFQGKTVTVVDYTGEGAEEVNFLSEFCSKVIYLNYSKKEYSPKKQNIEVITGEQPVEIAGEDTVRALNTTGRTIETDGIFIFRQTYPPGELVPGMAIEEGSIKIDRKMATNIKGLFAAGDCTGKPYQVAKSVGEGQSAALNAVAYLDSL